MISQPAVAPHRAIPSPVSLRRELECANRELEGCISQLEELLSGRNPDRGLLTGIRLKLSQLRLIHAPLIGRICRHLEGNVGPDSAAALRQVQTGQDKLLHAIAAHTCIWTLPAVEGDWPGYVAATRDILSRWVLKTRMEQQVIYPLLSR